MNFQEAVRITNDVRKQVELLVDTARRNLRCSSVGQITADEQTFHMECHILGDSINGQDCLVIVKGCGPVLGSRNDILSLSEDVIQSIHANLSQTDENAKLKRENEKLAHFVRSAIHVQTLG